MRVFVAGASGAIGTRLVPQPVKSEDDPLDPTPVPAMRESFAAMRHLDISPSRVSM